MCHALSCCIFFCHPQRTQVRVKIIVVSYVLETWVFVWPTLQVENIRIMNVCLVHYYVGSFYVQVFVSVAFVLFSLRGGRTRWCNVISELAWERVCVVKTHTSYVINYLLDFLWLNINTKLVYDNGADKIRIL